MDPDRLTQEEYWDNYWRNLRLPSEIRKVPGNLYLNAILRVFDRYFPPDERLSILEIGGAPGQYLAYMHRTFGYSVHCLDYSKMGCLKAKENLELLDIRGTVHHADLFSEELQLSQFDIVYSLGFVEHFSDPGMVIERHLRLLKPGGILLIGLPNFLGIYRFFLKRLSPELLASHNLRFMDIRTWGEFEKNLDLQILFKGYVGGFEPRLFSRRGARGSSRAVLGVARALDRVFHSHLGLLRKLNSRLTSGYAIGVYRKAGHPGPNGRPPRPSPSVSL